MNWLESPAHRAAFVRLEPRVFGDPHITHLWNEWDPPLGEPHAVAVQRWLDEGCYRRGGLTETLYSTLSGPKLMAMLKERGPSSKGEKTDLINRLASADPQVAQAYANAHPVWILTDESLRRQDEFRAKLRYVKVKLKETTQQSADLKINRAFAQARDEWIDNDNVIGVEIFRGPAGGCGACEAIVGCWRKESVPDVPSIRCTNQNGLHCFWTTISRDQSPTSAWRTLPADSDKVSPLG